MESTTLLVQKYWFEEIQDVIEKKFLAVNWSCNVEVN